MRTLGVTRQSPFAARQRGQTIFLAAIFLLLGVSAAIYAVVDTSSVSLANRQAESTARTLREVKDALIGWSAARDPASDGVDARPGELPCPDINPLDGYEDGSCVAGALGRVPWKTLGIPEPKDEAGETLWYTVAGSFRKYNNSTTPITSSTLGNLVVYHNSTSTLMTSQAVAVLFAPGSALDTQNRSTTDTQACTAPSGTYTRDRCASNYLETAGTVNNATINGPFINAQPSNVFNDRLLAITNQDLLPVVEQSVARKMIEILNAYKAATANSPLYPGGIYPWADLADGHSNGALTLAAYNRSRFPCGTALPVDWGTAVPSSAPATTTPALPNWLTNGCWATGWTSIIYYAVAKNRLEGSGAGCTTCCKTWEAPWCSIADTLTLANTGNRMAVQCTSAVPPACEPRAVTSGATDLVLLMPGPATSSPHGDWPTAWSNISGYIDDAENSDHNDDNFLVPTATAYSRDRLFIVR